MIKRGAPGPPGGSGFTLIEIIAVLVLLGILTAMAVPRFLGIQERAREEGLQALAAAAQSQLASEYARALLQEGGDTSAAWAAVVADVTGACERVSREGWLADASLVCRDAGATRIVITATHRNVPRDVTGGFTRPGE